MARRRPHRSGEGGGTGGKKEAGARARACWDRDRDPSLCCERVRRRESRREVGSGSVLPGGARGKREGELGIG